VAERLTEWIKSILLSTEGITIGITILIAVLASMHKGSYILVNTIITGGMWALMAIGIALLFGVMNVSNFAHGEYFMLGSLIAFFIYMPISKYVISSPDSILSYIGPLIAIMGGALGGVLSGGITERLIFKQLRMRNRQGWLLNCFLITTGLSVIMQNAHQLFFGTNFKGILAYWDFPSISILGVNVSIDRLATFVIAMLTMLAFYLFMIYSTTGKSIRAVSQDEKGARMVGISVDSVHLITFSLACGLAALAGACLLFIFPSYPMAGVVPLYNSWFVIILVGFGNVAGSVPGGFIIGLFQVLTRTYFGEGWETVVPVLLIAAVLVVRPSGIFATKVRTIWDI